MTSSHPRPGLTLEVTPALLSFIRGSWKPGENQGLWTPGTGQTRCPSGHRTFVAGAEMLPPRPPGPQQSAPSDGRWGKLATHSRGGTGLLSSGAPPCPPYPPAARPRAPTHPPVLSCPGPGLQAGARNLVGRDAQRPARLVPRGLQSHARAFFPESPKTCFVETRTPFSRKLMKTAFMRQLFSGVNFVGRQAGPGENRRGPPPPCTAHSLADGTQAGGCSRAWTHHAFSLDAETPEVVLLLVLGPVALGVHRVCPGAQHAPR